MAETDEDSGRRFGFVAFDDPQDPGPGWSACGREYRRIASPSQLSSDTIWWSNISFESFFYKTEVWRQPNLRHDKFLVVAPPDILREWGHDPQKVSIEFLCTFMALAFDRIMRCAFTIIRDVNPRLKISEAFRGKTLREDMRICLPEMEYPKGEAALSMKRGVAYEEYTPTGAKSPRGSKRILLRKPRLSYAMEMLQTPVPKGPYVLMDRKELRAATNDRVRYVLESTEPMIVDVSLTIQPDVASVYGFGAAMDKSSRIPRSWVPHSEFIVLHRFADIEIRNLWKAERYWGVLTEIPESVKAFLECRLSDISWTAGVVAETIWRAIALAPDSQKSKLGPGENRADTSWQGLWLKGADKTSMFTTALRLSELGYSVQSYGQGGIRCAVPEEEVENYIRDGLTLGLLPQLSEVPAGMFTPGDIPWAGDKRLLAYVHMLLTKQDDHMWNFDQVALIAPGPRREALMNKLRESLNKKRTRKPEETRATG